MLTPNLNLIARPIPVEPCPLPGPQLGAIAAPIRPTTAIQGTLTLIAD